MFFNTRRIVTRPGFRAVWAMLFGAVFALTHARGGAQTTGGDVAATTERVLMSFDDIWQLPQAELQQWHRVKLDYVVYYYDPLWKAMWGRSQEAESYLSLGTKVFPIRAGQRIQVEGAIRPAGGMRIEDAKVTVLEESVPLTAISTKGAVGNVERFNKRRVTVEGYVDRQAARDANHLEISLIAEGRSVLVQVLLKNDTPAPQLRDKFIRATGVYFARSDDGRSGAKIELWVQQDEDIEVFGSLDRDPRFELPVTPASALGEQLAERVVRITGAVVSHQAGQSLTIRDGAMSVVLNTAQTLNVRAGEVVEAVGFPMREASGWALRESLVRPLRPLFTSVHQLWDLPESERRKWQRVQLDTVVYYYDPLWQALWGNIGGTEDYISLGEHDFGLKPGQRVRIEGSLLVENGVLVDNPRVTVLEDGVPLEPLSTVGRIRDADLFNKQWVTVEGYVDRQGTSDARHALLDLVVEGRPVTGRLLLAAGETAPNWEGSIVRLRGVYSATQDPSGGMTSIEIWMPAVENVEVLGTLDSDPRFELPLTSIDQLGRLPAGTSVRVAGVVRAQQPGRLLTIRDETGQMDLQTAQARPTEIGEMVEAVGVVTAHAAETTIGGALFRTSKRAVPLPPGGLPKLRLADQLRELSPEEAARSYPVQLTGMITWAGPDAEFFFVRDVSGGVCVYRPPGMTQSLAVGRTVELTGVSASGRFTPVVLASTVQPLGTVDLPEPRLVTLEQALTGVEEAQWVTMSGYVRGVERDGPWMRLNLTTFGGEFHAMLPASSRWSEMPGAVVRLRGVCSAIANDKRQLTGIQLWVASSRFVEIEEAAPEDPFSVERRSIASLRQFGTLQVLNRRVRVAGVVVHHELGRLVNIQGGNEGLLVLSRDTQPLLPGDRIEAVGFPGRENSRAVLREAVYRRIESGEEPEPVVVEDIGKIDVELDGRLVRVQSLLLDVGARERGVELINQQGDVVFRAQLGLADGEMVEWEPQSQLVLTGVYEVSYDEYRRPHEVRLKLRTSGDVAVVRRPSWWTVKKVLALTGVLAVAAVLGFGWVVALRRRVREQTDVIRERLENERAARLEAALARASKLESLGVLAGGIAHDFNNLLTVILGNVSLAKMDARIDSETVHCLDQSERAAQRARDLTQQLLTFAKGGEPMRAATRLPDIVREAAQFALHGSKVRSEFEIASDLWPADVDRGQIGQVVHNIVINAHQAMPSGGMIRVSLRNEEISEPRSGLAAGRYVRLSFTDTGAGINADTLARIFEPYFSTKKQGSGLGLATVYSIVKKHQGHIEVTSKVGQGTTFTVWVPAAMIAAATIVPDAVKRARERGRVLLMDDEESIRLLGSAVLKRLGFEVTAVNDGSAVVNEYASASAAGRRFDLVILDLTVPGGMGGAEAMAKLREMDGEVTAIVSSGYSSDPVMANYRAHGFRGRVPKPYAADDLIRVVEDLTRGVRSEAVGV